MPTYYKCTILVNIEAINCDFTCRWPYVWSCKGITMTLKWVQRRLKSPASRLFIQSFLQAQIKETSKLRFAGLCEGNSPVTGEFLAQRASNAENVFIWWRHHDKNNRLMKNNLSFRNDFHAADKRLLTKINYNMLMTHQSRTWQSKLSDRFPTVDKVVVRPIGIIRLLTNYPIEIIRDLIAYSVDKGLNCLISLYELLIRS